MRMVKITADTKIHGGVCKSINFAVNAGERQITEEKQR